MTFNRANHNAANRSTVNRTVNHNIAKTQQLKRETVLVLATKKGFFLFIIIREDW